VLRHPLVDVPGAGRALLFPQGAIFDAIDVGDRATRIGGVIDDVVPLALQARGLGLLEILFAGLGACGRVSYVIVVGRLLCPLGGVGGARTGAAFRTRRVALAARLVRRDRPIGRASSFQLFRGVVSLIAYAIYSPLLTCNRRTSG
jgi:hypothetical protein